MCTKNPLKVFWLKVVSSVFHPFFPPVISNGLDQTVPKLLDWKKIKNMCLRKTGTEADTDNRERETQVWNPG